MSKYPLSPIKQKTHKKLILTKKGLRFFGTKLTYKMQNLVFNGGIPLIFLGFFYFHIFSITMIIQALAKIYLLDKIPVYYNK